MTAREHFDAAMVELRQALAAASPADRRKMAAALRGVVKRFAQTEAATDGEVTALVGGVVTIRSGEGGIFNSPHLDRLYVVEGQQVKKGDIIGEWVR